MGISADIILSMAMMARDRWNINIIYWRMAHAHGHTCVHNRTMVYKGNRFLFLN